MKLIRRLLARIRNRRFDSDLAEELQFHEEMKRRELETQGIPVEESRARARRALGNVTPMREAARGVWIAPSVESVLQDVRYAVRSLLRQPTYRSATTSGGVSRNRGRGPRSRGASACSA